MTSTPAVSLQFLCLVFALLSNKRAAIIRPKLDNATMPSHFRSVQVKVTSPESACAEKKIYIIQGATAVRGAEVDEFVMTSSGAAMRRIQLLCE